MKYSILALLLVASLSLSGCGSGFEWFPGTTQSLKIVTTTLPNAAIGAPYSQVLFATGGKTPYAWTLDAGTTLPDGLTLSFAGIISGTPTATSKTSTFTVKVVDSESPNVSATQSLTITIPGTTPLAISTNTLPNAPFNIAYSQTLAATGGSGTYTWSLDSGTPPAGLTLSPSGVISGTLTAAAVTSTFTVKVTDSTTPAATTTQTFTIVAGTLLGGSVQGKSLVLSNTVTTFLGAAAGIAAPFGITTDGINLYVADAGNGIIQKIVIATGTVTTVATGFSIPSGITTDGTNLYVSDTGDNTVRKVVIATGAVTQVATGFNVPNGITTDGTNLYVTNNGDGTIQKILIADGTVSPVTVTPSGFFIAPSGITTDGVNLYVTDNGNNTISQVANGVATQLASGTVFSAPSGITTDGTNLYVVDANDSKIYKIVAGVATPIADSTSGLSAPYDITTDGISLYVTESGTGTIWKIQ